jgi:hypothetical protein
VGGGWRGRGVCVSVVVTCRGLSEPQPNPQFPATLYCKARDPRRLRRTQCVAGCEREWARARVARGGWRAAYPHSPPPPPTHPSHPQPHTSFANVRF